MEEKKGLIERLAQKIRHIDVFGLVGLNTKVNSGKVIDEIRHSAITTKASEETSGKTGVVNQKNNKKDSNLSLDYLTSEEYAIFREYYELVKKKMPDSEERSITLMSLLKGVSYEQKLNFYKKGEVFDWFLIKGDFYGDLYGKLLTKTDKDEVINLFKAVIEESKRIDLIQEEKNRELVEISVILRDLEKILKENSRDIYDYEGMTEYAQRLHDYVYDCVLIGELESVKQSFPDLDLDEVSVCKIQLRGLLLEIKEGISKYFNTLNAQVLSMEDIQNIKMELSNYNVLYKEYKTSLQEAIKKQEMIEVEKKAEEQKRIEEEKKNIEEDDGSLDFSLEYNEIKNCVLLLPTDGNTYTALNDIYDGRNDAKDTMKKEKVFNAFLRKITSTSLFDRANVFKGMSELHIGNSDNNHNVKVHAKPTIEEEYGFVGERVRLVNEGRVAYLLINVAKNNIEKLRQIYNNNNLFERYNSIPMVLGVITAASDHNDYDYFLEYIKDNIDYIRKLIDMFNNPNINITQLTSIIEESMSTCQEYIQTQKGKTR